MSLANDSYSIALKIEEFDGSELRISHSSSPHSDGYEWVLKIQDMTGKVPNVSHVFESATEAINYLDTLLE